MRVIIVAVMLTLSAGVVASCNLGQSSASDTIAVAKTDAEASAMRRAADDRAAVKHRETLNAAESKQVERTNTVIFWAFTIGVAAMCIGLFGLAICAIVPALRGFVGVSAALALGGLFVWAVALGLSDYRQTVALVAVCTAGGIGFGGLAWVGYAAYQSAKRRSKIVESVEQAKGLLSDSARTEMFGDGGALASVMDKDTRRDVAKIRSKRNATSSST